jgi:hypothetical protein
MHGSLHGLDSGPMAAAMPEVAAVATLVHGYSRLSPACQCGDQQRICAGPDNGKKTNWRLKGARSNGAAMTATSPFNLIRP